MQIQSNWDEGMWEQLINEWNKIQKSLEGAGKACKSMKAK
jgi:hypothetical protein